MLLRHCLAEAFGTFLLVLLGTGVVHAAAIGGAQGGGAWQAYSHLLPQPDGAHA